MREPSRTTSEDAESSALQSRRLLFAGACGSAGGSLAWLLWLFIHAIQRNHSTIFAPIIGACLGSAWHWATHYLQTARRERARKVKIDSHHAHASSVITPVFAALTFTGLICEHTLGGLAHEFFAPFLASLVTLFPAGAILGDIFLPVIGKTEVPKAPGSGRLLVGIFAGGLISCVLIAIHWLLLAGTPAHPLFPSIFLSLLGWWVLLSLWISLLPGSIPLSTPALAVLLGALTVVVMPWFGKLPFKGPFGIFVSLSSIVADSSLASPGTPWEFWSQAELDLESSERPSAHPLGWGDWLASLIDKSNQRSLSPEELSQIHRSYWSADATRKESLAARRHLIANELRREFNSGLVRSWLVMLFFAVGLGVAPLIEDYLRPAQYLGSATHRNDQTAWKIALLLMVAAIVAVQYSARRHPWFKAVSTPNRYASEALRD